MDTTHTWCVLEELEILPIIMTNKSHSRPAAHESGRVNDNRIIVFCQKRQALVRFSPHEKVETIKSVAQQKKILQKRWQSVRPHVDCAHKSKCVRQYLKETDVKDLHRGTKKADLSELSIAPLFNIDIRTSTNDKPVTVIAR